MTTNLVRLPGGRTAQGSEGDPGSETDAGVHRLFRARDDTSLSRGTTDDARFIGECIAAGALLGLVTAMARPPAGQRRG